MRIASLPMYDVPELRAATDALWAGVARALRARGIDGVPDELCRGRPLVEMWLDPDLLLSQTCGYPLVRALAGRVQMVATPRYRVSHCQGSWYRSHVMVARESPARSLADLAGAVCAVNEPDSHSGMNAMRALVAPLAGRQAFFGQVVWTGAHRVSLELVATGRADVAAIDCVSYALFERALPEMAARVRPIGLTDACPGLPIITRASASAGEIDAMRAALDEIAVDPDLAAARDSLFLEGFEVLEPGAYERVSELEAEAARLGYPELA